MNPKLGTFITMLFKKILFQGFENPSTGIFSRDIFKDIQHNQSEVFKEIFRRISEPKNKFFLIKETFQVLINFYFFIEIHRGIL